MKRSVLFLLVVIAKLNALDNQAVQSLTIKNNQALGKLNNGDVNGALSLFKEVLGDKSSGNFFIFDIFRPQIEAAEKIVEIYTNSNTHAQEADLKKETGQKLEKYTKLLLQKYEEAFEALKAKGDSANALGIAQILYTIYSNNGVYTSFDNHSYAVSLPNKDNVRLHKIEYYKKYIGDSSVHKDQEGVHLLQVASRDGLSPEDKKKLEKQAFESFKDAEKTEQNSFVTHFNLANMYKSGRGTSIDLDQAYRSVANALSLAANEQDKKSAELLKKEIQARKMLKQALEKLAEAQNLESTVELQELAPDSDAVKLLQDAHELYPDIYLLQYKLAEVYIDASGIQFDEDAARQHLQNAQRLALATKQKNEVAALEKAFKMKVKKSALSDDRNRRAFARVFGTSLGDTRPRVTSSSSVKSDDSASSSKSLGFSLFGKKVTRKDSGQSDE